MHLENGWVIAMAASNYGYGNDSCDRDENEYDEYSCTGICEDWYEEKYDEEAEAEDRYYEEMAEAAMEAFYGTWA